MRGNKAGHEAHDVFRAIADPTRRTILDRLLDRPRTVTGLSKRFDMTQPALSQHLRILLHAGLVKKGRLGRETFYRVSPRPFLEVHGWVDRYVRLWRSRLAAARGR